MRRLLSALQFFNTLYRYIIKRANPDHLHERKRS